VRRKSKEFPANSAILASEPDRREWPAELVTLPFSLLFSAGPIGSPVLNLTEASKLSFSALDAKIDEGLQTGANDLSALVPYLLEMHQRLSAPGRRTDLRKGAPAGLTWTAWVTV